MLNQSRRMLLAALLIAAVIVGGWFVLRPREPEYEGRKLSQWLRQLESDQDIESTSWQTSARALRQMGTNTLPWLIGPLRTSDPKWKVRTIEWFRDVMNKDFSHQLVERDRLRSLMALQVLGPVARPLIPGIGAMITNANPDIADAAFAALMRIGTPECVPVLVNTMTNGSPTLRPAAIVSLGFLRGVARDAVPPLVKTLDHPGEDGRLRFEAAQALGMIGRNSQLVVPTLTRALSDTNAQVARAAAIALGAFGSDAESALPALRSLPASMDELPRRSIARSIVRVQCEMRDGGILRGPKDERRLAFVFTGHEFAEGGDVILNELRKHGGKGSFFLTGDFLRNPEFATLVARIFDDGHYLGPHSDKHLLYCSWENPKNTLVTEEQFTSDLIANMRLIPAPTRATRRPGRYFLPAFEHFNGEIVDWTHRVRWTLINFTPGTRSNADYTGEADKNFVSSQAIFESILKREREDPHGLNGFLLLLHVGSGPGRADKFHPRFGELLDTLAARGYRFVGVDELLEPKQEEMRNDILQPIYR